MDELEQNVDAIHTYIIERYPMYVANPGFEQWLLRRAGNNRANVEEYLTLLEDYGYMLGDGTLAGDYQAVPLLEDVAGDVEQRLSALTPDTRALLRCASVQGERFNRDSLAMLGTKREDYAPLLEEAVRAGIIAPDQHASRSAIASHYRFVPARVAGVLYEELPEEERARYHTEMVESLSAQAEQTTDLGTQDMLSQMISEHNKSFARPDASSSKE